MPPADRVNRVGLCLDCRYACVIRSRTGQSYYRCGWSDDDGRYPRYPRLPVLSCDACESAQGGTEPVDASQGRPDAPAGEVSSSRVD